MTELWDEIEYLIKTIKSGEAGEYDKDLMRVTLNADDNLGLGSILKIHILTAIVRSVSEEDSKYYPQVLLGECLYELQKCCSMIELIFSEEIGINETCASKECMIFHYWYFKDIGYKFEPHVCNGCHEKTREAYELKNIAILNVKGVDYRCVLRGVTKNDAIDMLGNCKLDGKGTLWIWFWCKKTSVEVIKEGTFGGSYFRDIFSGVNSKNYRKSWKEFDKLKNIDREYYYSIYYDASVNKYRVKWKKRL